MTLTPTASTTSEIVDRFNAAWAAHDLDAALALISADCVLLSPRSFAM